MVIKLDLKKAYDRIEWAFIRDTLTKLCSPENLIDVIMLCVTFASFRILWNGETTKEFKPTRGLRQRDFLSPYLFVLYHEKLGHLIEEKVMLGLWKSISLNR